MRWILCAYLLTGVALAIAADLGVYAPGLREVHAAPMGDKLLHALFAGGLALTVNAALIASGRFAARRAILLGVAISVVVCTLEEATNLLTPHRGAELLDLAANYLGILVIGVVPAALYAAIRRRPAPMHGV